MAISKSLKKFLTREGKLISKSKPGKTSTKKQIQKLDDDLIEKFQRTEIIGKKNARTGVRTITQ